MADIKHSSYSEDRAALAAAAVVVGAILAALVINAAVISPAKRYNAAFALLDTGNEQEALEIFQELGDYKDSRAYVKELLELAEREGGLRSESLDLPDRGEGN